MIDRQPSLDKLGRLYARVWGFVERHEISHAETIHQSDAVLLALPDLLESLCEVIGYYEPDEDDEREPELPLPEDATNAEAA